MAEKDKKYYWLKLKRDFFKRHDIQIIEDMPNGKDYILFYLKLLCESVDHDGNLRFNEEIPYNEEMLSTITRTNIDTVRSAIKVFSQLQMMEILDNGTIYMKEVKKMLGSESYWAEQKRIQRQKRTLIGQSPTSPSKSIDKEIDKDIELDKELEKDRDIDIIFKEMMNELKKKIPPLTYDTFFESLEHNGVKDNRLVLVALPFTKDIITEKYMSYLLSALEKASGGKLNYVIWEE